MSESTEKRANFLDLYKGNDFDIWIEMDPEMEMVTLNLFGRATFSFDRQEFQELYNAMFISKQMLKELDDKK